MITSNSKRSQHTLRKMLEQEQGNERNPLLPNFSPQAEDFGSPISYGSHEQQYSDQRLINNSEIDVTLRRQPHRFIMSPARRIFCGIVILDMLLTFIIWIISCQVLMFLSLKILLRKL